MSHLISKPARDPVDVLHTLAKTYRDKDFGEGIAAVARRIGRSPGILHNKFSESMPSYDLMFREAMAIAHLVGGESFVAAVCEQFGGTFLPLPPGAPAEDDVLQAYLGIIQQMGELSKEFTEARADGVIDPEEFNALKLRAHRTVAAVMHMLAELENLVRDVPSALPTLKKVGG